MSVAIPSNPSPQLQTALKWIDGFNRLDLDQQLSLCADDYTHYGLPKSLGIEPQKSKGEWKEKFGPILSMFQEFTMTILEIIETPGKVFFHASSKATSTTGFPYANEYNFVLHLTAGPDGLPKISLVKEFMDSKLTGEFFVEEKERQAAKQV